MAKAKRPILTDIDKIFIPTGKPDYQRKIKSLNLRIGGVYHTTIRAENQMPDLRPFREFFTNEELSLQTIYIMNLFMD